MSEPQKFISDYLEKNDEALAELIRENPIYVSVSIIAKFLGTTVDSVRSMIENGAFGAAWKKPGKENRGFFVPTAQFVRWYRKWGNAA